MSFQGFSKFSWALALFCLPSALFPLALMISPQFSHHSALSPMQINLFSTAFWIYPVVLLTVAGMLAKLHRTAPRLAQGLLATGFAAFYGLLWHIVSFF